MRHPRLLLPLGALLGLFLLVPAANAQLMPNFGITGGLNFGNISDAANANLDQAAGYHVGIYADLSAPLIPVGVRASMLYVRAGDIAFPSAVPFLGSDAAIEFVAIPIDLKYQAGLPVVQPYGFIGPELRFPLGDLRGHPNTRDMPVAIGLGVGADIGAIVGPQLFAELRYSLDVTGFMDGNDSLRVSLFYLRVGIGF